MSHHILCEFEVSWSGFCLSHSMQKTTSFLSSKRKSKKSFLRSIEHCIIPKMFVIFVATLPDKYVSTNDNGTKPVLTAGGYRVSLTMPLLSPMTLTYFLQTQRDFCTDSIVTVCLFLRIKSASSRQFKIWLNFTSYFTNWITSNKRSKPHCYAAKTTDTKRKAVIASIMDKRSWNIGSTEQFEPNFDCSLLSDIFCDTNAECRESCSFLKTYRTSANTTLLNSETP